MNDTNYQLLADPTTEARNGIITRYAAGIGLVILSYDLIITMQSEVRDQKFS
jgi:hypothetical protein